VIDLNFITVIGNDLFNRPAILVRPGIYKPGSLNYDQLDKLMVLFLDLVLNDLEGDLENVLIVIDYEAWSLSHIDKKLDHIFFTIGQTYYPERLYKGVLFKPPVFFSAVWKVVKNFLDERTVAKVNHVRKWTSVILKLTTIVVQTFYTLYRSTCSMIWQCFHSFLQRKIW